jgi:hypothetical protein
MAKYIIKKLASKKIAPPIMTRWPLAPPWPTGYSRKLPIIVHFVVGELCFYV